MSVVDVYTLQNTMKDITGVTTRSELFLITDLFFMWNVSVWYGTHNGIHNLDLILAIRFSQNIWGPSTQTDLKYKIPPWTHKTWILLPFVYVNYTNLNSI